MKKFLLYATILLVGLCLLLTVVERQTHVLRRAYDNWILDNENHYLPCGKLPAVDEVERIVQEHQDLIRQIEQVHPGQVVVEVDTMTCPGKADLVIFYPSHQDRIAIKKLIGADTFFGVPYRMVNW